MAVKHEHLKPGELHYSHHLISTHHWPVERLTSVLNEAMALKKSKKPSDALHQKIMAMLFFNPSLRTRSSFAAAMAQLGGSSYELNVGQNTWKLEPKPGAVMDGDKTEHVKDAAIALSSYCDVMGVRAFAPLQDWAAESAEPTLTAFARHSRAPLINLESSLYHPCQALADMQTLAEKFGGVNKLRKKKLVMTWVYHPKATPLAVNFSSALAAAQFGMDVTLLHPPGFAFDSSLMGMLRHQTDANGGSLSTSLDFAQGLEGADAIYAKSYCPPAFYGKSEADAAARAKYKNWKIDAAALSRAPKAALMHCMPMRRNVEITDEAADGPQSVIYQQADNRLHAQKAVLLELLNHTQKK